MRNVSFAILLATYGVGGLGVLKLLGGSHIESIHGRVVGWRFSVRDSFGRTSNVIEKPVTCGLCVEPKPQK
jgi:hypothetical protein